MDPWFAKLRSNITLDEDVDLARNELLNFFGSVNEIESSQDITSEINIPSFAAKANTRDNPPIGFLIKNHFSNLNELAKSLSFIQELWISPASYPINEPWCVYRPMGENSGAYCIIPLMAMAELLSYNGDVHPDSRDVAKIASALAYPENGTNIAIKKAIGKRNTSTPHVHGLHKYKAKFFPRMIRSVLVAYKHQFPVTESGRVLLLDPFVGSGTALVEATLLGIDSIGIDIDKLSCAISQAKIDALTQTDPITLRKYIEEMRIKLDLFQKIDSGNRYSFPPWIQKKFERWHLPEEQKKYEIEIGRWIAAINTVEDDNSRKLFQICLSDSLSRKFNVRMMGTGVGRFALEIQKTDLSKIMNSNLHALSKIINTCISIKKAYKIGETTSIVMNNTATAMPIVDESVSVVLTSPPYLPASSGRENYLISKSISITALGIMTPDEILKAEVDSIGSMKSNARPDFKGLPPEVENLYDWLKSDELREIKAIPTIGYYQSLHRALKETYRVALPGSIAMYVIGKESVFYRFKTREVLYRVHCDDIFEKLARSNGFDLVNRINVLLDKKNSNARPRSLDKYYETVFILRKPK